MTCLECLCQWFAEWQWTYCLTLSASSAFKVKTDIVIWVHIPALLTGKLGHSFWEMWAAAEIYMPTEKGSHTLWAPSLGEVLCPCCSVVFPQKYKHAARHWLAMVTWLCSWEGYLGGGIWARLWRAIPLNVSFDYKRMCDYYTITGMVCQEEKKTPLFPL